MPKPKHILVIRFSAMGDVAMVVPVLRALSNQYPNLKITVLTRAFFKPLFQGIRNVEVYPADLKGKHKGLVGLYKLSEELKKLKFDAVADLHNVLRSKVLKILFYGKNIVQLDKGRSEKRALVSGASFRQLKTTHERYADVFRTLGFLLDLSKTEIPPKLPLKNELKGLLPKDNLPLVGIAPFAAHKSKMYPLNKMEKVIAELSKFYQVYLFGGGENEIKILRDIAARYDGVVSVAGHLSFENELKLISNLDLMLSMDSGNAHIASIFGVKVISIWGVTHPYAGFAPFGQPIEFAMLADRSEYPLIPTSIYGNKYPEGYEDCAGSIPINNIVSKVKEQLSSK
ncbi:glycosyltransferase family 9 protein [Winogradskyella alexanderae]|uniref:Glycosyltransferase family 9 protein n=1 Tax=Winogradskyella alexanderae TaxID=2877123 RepID=A0ABS7XMU8_9FLAO|nr:glycosyltransferase family 9 protein [Winogradskyella alexanderae]MCA0131313.1 glycosyltransferase family 9 protein [Winogradskyella alexanderae]